MGLLIFVWGIYTELQNCMYQMAHGPCLSQSLGFQSMTITSLTGQINKLHPPLWTPFDGKKTKGIWSFGIRLILACVQDSLIIQKSYNTRIMIQILSCVPALNTIIWYPLRLIVVMISVFYQELPTICIDNIHKYNVKYINVCP